MSQDINLPGFIPIRCATAISLAARNRRVTPHFRRLICGHPLALELCNKLRATRGFPGLSAGKNSSK